VAVDAIRAGFAAQTVHGVVGLAPVSEIATDADVAVCNAGSPLSDCTFMNPPRVVSHLLPSKLSSNQL
jgi:hypothetical protein